VLKRFLEVEALREAIGAGGWTLVGLGQGDPRALKSWGRLNKWPGALYTDQDQPKLPAFVMLGANFKMPQAPCSRLCKDFCFGLCSAIATVWCSCPPKFDLQRGAAKANVIVQAGVIALDYGDTVFQQHVKYITDNLPAADLTVALKAATPAAPVT